MLQKYLVLVLILISTNSFAGEPTPPFNAVQRMFSAMSAFDYPGIRAATTDDFHILEAGEIGDADILINAVKSAENRYKDKGTFSRRNFFSVIRTETKKDVVWVSYWNKAVYTSAEGEGRDVIWLESAVMLKVNDEWKVQLLHSTPLGPTQKLPDDVVLEEYTD